MLLQTGCAMSSVSVMRRSESLNITVPIHNGPDSGDAISSIWVSYASPSYFVFNSSSSDTGPAAIPIGKTWVSSGTFSFSTEAPLGCHAVAYSINTTEPVATDDDEAPISYVKALVTSDHPSLWQRASMPWRRLNCRMKKFKVEPDWKWTQPGPIPEEVPPPPSDMAEEDQAAVSRMYPLGNFGFHLGAALTEVDANAERRKLRRVDGTNVSVKPDEWRYFEVLGHPHIGSVTMFLKDGVVSQLNVNYKEESATPSFSQLRKRFRKYLGKEAGDDTEAFWSDGNTVIVLRGRQVGYHDLRKLARLRFTTIGSNKSYFFYPGRRHDEAPTETSNPAMDHALGGIKPKVQTPIIPAESETTSKEVQLTAELGKYPELRYRAINNGKRAITLGIMSCSKMDNWSTDSAAVQLVWPGFRGCDKNVCQAHTLQQGAVLDGTLQVAFLAGGKNNGSFRLHLKSCSHLGANEHELNVVPDLWSEPIRMSHGMPGWFYSTFGPGEHPFYARATVNVPLYSSPDRNSARVIGDEVHAGEVIGNRGGIRFRTVRSGELLIKNPLSLPGHNFGAIDVLALESPSTLKTYSFEPGRVLEYLRYRGEGFCLVRIDGEVVEIPEPPAKSAELRKKPETELWIGVLGAFESGRGWALFDDSSFSRIEPKKN